jgi:hypothetical protein
MLDRKTIMSKSPSNSYYMRNCGLVNLNEVFSPPAAKDSGSRTSFSASLSENKFIKMRK